MKKFAFVFLILAALFCLAACVPESQPNEPTPHMHNYGEWEITTAATCTQEGEKSRYCACGDTQTATVPATGHAYSEWETVKAPTCTEAGEKAKTCKCGDKLTEVIPATGHSYSEWATVKAPTCTEAGEKAKTCECGDKQTEAIPATGHDWKDATCESPKTCQSCGITDGEALGHINNGSGICSRCGEKCTIDMKTVVGHPDECNTTRYFGFCFYKNSADGIKLCWGGENLSGKTINYYTVTLYFYNAVGDPAYSEITGKSSKTIRYVGPIAPNKDLLIFGIVDYVPACSKVAVGEIVLEYSDGTTDSGWYGWATTYKNSSIK